MNGARFVPLVALPLVACALDPVDYAGKTCPCGDGFRCDATTNRCVSTSPSGSSSSGGCTPMIVPSKLRVAWATPNALRWAWEATGSVDQFGAYRFVIAATKEAAASEAGATVFTAKENPELGKLNLIHTGGVDPVLATMTDGLAPATTYWGKLVATDSAGCEAQTDVLSGTTSVASTGRISLFDGAIPMGGYTLPGSVVVDPKCPSGAPCLLYTSGCKGMALCYENVRLDFDVAGASIGAAMTKGDFANLAYLEMQVGTDGTSPSYWSAVRLKTDDFYAREALTLRADGAMRTLQIPLRVLVTSAPLTYEDLVAAGAREVGVGGDWTNGAHVWMGGMALAW